MEKRVEEGFDRGNETILVVEDNHEVRKLTDRILRIQGYRVLGASSWGNVFRICERYESPIHHNDNQCGVV